ncbi:MAG: response regulator [Lachnospiraceae bacterium]|nr:response regulator [Lachnospiraceae bacterium]
MAEKIKTLVGQLRQSIYTGERREKQMNMIFKIGFIIAAIGALMTILNIVQHKGLVTYTTIIICAAGIIISIAVKVFENIKIAIVTAWLFCILVFSYYTITGTNEGFAILWTLMVPLALGYFCGILYGLSVSVYYELLFIVLFYTPLRAHMGEFYSETFMLRYPILYLTSILINSVTMISNHVSTLTLMESEKRIAEALKLAEEESARAQAANESKSAFLSHMSHEKKYHEQFTAPDADILIVDDNPMNLMVFKSLIKRTLVNVDTAEDGDRGLVMASRKKYDIIFLDHMMPGKNGIETLHELKADKNGINCDTTVICLTANAISGAKETYIKEGFEGYLSKPIDSRELEDMLMAYIPKEKLCAPGKVEEYKAETNAYEDEFVIADDDELESLKDGPIDPAEGLKNNGGKENYRQILKIFIDSAEEKISELDRLYDTEDYDGYTIKVHAMKSSARIIGAKANAEKAQLLENAGKSGDTDFIKSNHSAFINEYRALKELVMPLFENESIPDKPVADDELVTNAFDSVKEAALQQDCDMLDAIFEELEEYAMPETEAKRWEKIQNAYKVFDYDLIVDLVKGRSK